jgi:glycosyltransferase involved in cell wall biosynthesis
MGNKVMVVAPEFSGDLQGKNRIDVLRVPAIQNFNGSDFSVRIPLPFVINEKIDSFDPHIIHSHHPFLLGDAALRVARKRRLPLIFTHHTLYEQYTHYVPFDSEAMKRFTIQLSTEYANLCTRVVAPSLSVARLLHKRGVNTPIKEIPTGVETQFFSGGHGDETRQVYGIDPDALVIGHVGRLAPEKNLDYLAESVALFLEKHRNAIFLIGGSGPSEEAIRRIFSSKNIDQQIRMIGTVTGQELVNLYAAMDLFVFSSKSETQGMVLTEAMAAGTPVIALDASGAREVVRDGQNGRLLPETTPPRYFAQAMEEYVRNPSCHSDWHKEALKTSESFSRRASAEKLIHLYKSIVGDNYKTDTDDKEQLVPWDLLLQRLKTEWDLFSEKTRAATSTITDGENTHVSLE